MGDVPRGWWELRLPPDADTREVRDYIQTTRPELKLGDDFRFVVSAPRYPSKVLSELSESQLTLSDT
jgi:hypothetical protein